MMWRTTAGVTCLLGLCLASSTFARPPHKKALADYVGPRLDKKLNDCRTCHLPDDPDDKESALDTFDKPHNAFGARLKAVKRELKKAGKKTGIPARLEAVAQEDSDGDGVPNMIELLTGHYPGEDDDTPNATEVTAGKKALAELAAAQSGYPWTPFEPVKRPDVPALAESGWVRNPIDAFISVEHERRGLKHRPEAPKAVLLRRIYLDLIGLPPQPDELSAFLEDDSPNAYEQVVDRLLASPRYGERWGRHWMDVWRYSDWAGWGEQVRDSLPHIWHWRDWIIESLNKDKPYDRMVVEMLAADEAAPDDPDALRATGYLVRNFKLLSREKWMQDVVDHTSQAFLGVTLGCARCHDHMYEPILQKEYYQVRAIFEPHNVRTDRVPGETDVKKAGLPRAYDSQLDAKTFLFIRGDDRNPAKDALAPGVPEFLGGTLPAVEPVSLPTQAYAPDRREFVVSDDLKASRAVVDAARRALSVAERNVDQAALKRLLGSHLNDVIKAFDGLEPARLELALAEARYASLEATVKTEQLEAAGRKATEAWTACATAALRAQRRLVVADAQLSLYKALAARQQGKPTLRAELDKKAAEAQLAVAKAEAALHQPDSTAYARRNVPAYPKSSTGRRLAFARWIASRENPLTARVAMNHIWLRHFGQAIVPSVNDFGRNGRPATHPALLDWLACELMDRGWSMKAMHRLIVTSSAYRQASTPDASDLDRDPDNTYVWRFSPRRLEAEIVRDSLFAVAGTLDLTQGGPDIKHEKGLTVPRRSVYFQHAAEKQMEFLQIFDGPSVTECYRRHESTMPQQALALANSELAIRQSRILARSLAERVGPDPAEFTAAAFARVLSRPATKDELIECVAFLIARERKLASAPAHPTPASTSSDAAQPSPDPHIRARENLVHVLMNHHDFVTIR